MVSYKHCPLKTRSVASIYNCLPHHLRDRIYFSVKKQCNLESLVECILIYQMRRFFIYLNKAYGIMVSLVFKLSIYHCLMFNSSINFTCISSNPVQSPIHDKMRFIASQVSRTRTKQLASVKLLMYFKA